MGGGGGGGGGGPWNNLHCMHVHGDMVVGILSCSGLNKVIKAADR